MIILEFLVFVISSGLFCSERFRHQLWAVLAAGGIATGSSLLFVYDLGAKLAGHENQPPVITKIVKQVVVAPGQNSQPSSAGKAHNCGAEYPSYSLDHHQEGVTALAFNILTDGTVDAVKVLASSGSQALDEAAVKCVSEWHYRPAIKNGQLAETPWKAKVTWRLPAMDELAHPESAPDASHGDQPQQTTTTEPKTEPAAAPKEGHAWYDVGSWFSSDSDKKDQ